MTEKEVKGRLNLVRFGGLVVTIMTFVILIAVVFLVGQTMQASGASIVQDNLLLIILGTVMAAVVSVVFYFLYRAYLMRRVQS